MDPNNLPESFFQSLKLSDAIVNDVKESFKAGKSIIEALRHARSTTPAADVSSHERLRWISDTVTIVGNDLNACLFLLNDDSLKSLYDAAVKFYHSGTIVGKSKPIRAALLYRVPTAVLSGIVNQNLLGLKPGVQQLLSKVLELATAEEFDLRSDILGKLISQPKYQSILAQDDTGEVQRTLESLYRLHCIVKDAEDLKYLVGTRFTSAHSIASTDFDTFTAAMEEKKMSPLVSGRIHTEATRIDRRNEAYWLDIVKSRQNVPILAIAGRETQDDSDADTVPANLTTLFQDLDSVKSDDSTSVLSPACYLVDLLGILKGVTLTNPLFKIDNAKTALDVLLHRRPDIAKRELSKENTETPIVYMDLAIEVMESYVAKQLNLQGHPRMDIYAHGLNHQLVPLAIFPYNNAIATSRNYLKERGYSRYELLHLFRSDHDLASRAFPLIPSRGVGIARETNDRRLAAEYLGLQPADFKAITQEAFHTQKFVNQLRDQKPELATRNYSDIIGLPSAGDYWGYEADAGNKTKTANWQMIDQASENSLRLVEKELLPRSGLTSSELNTVLKTRYIGRRLVMTMERDGEFSDHLRDMRLQESSLVTDTEVTGQLSERTLQDLQAFLRLRYRLGWPIEVVDAAIATLARQSPVYSGSDRTFHVLDGGFVERLAAARQFSVLTGLSLPAVLPFWGPMDAEFPTSLYTKLFLGSNSLKQYPYLRIKDGETVKDATFGHNLDAMLLSLRMTPADWLIFADLLELDQSTPWTLDRVAQVYSHHTLCRLIGLPAKRYRNWWSLCQQRANPFLDPQSAITALTPWIDLSEGFKSAEAALGLVLPPDVTSEATSPELAFIAQALQGLGNVELKYEKILKTELDIEAAQVYTADALASLCSLVLGRTASMDVVQLVDGSSGFNVGIPLPKETKIPSSLQRKAVKQFSGSVRLYGILLQNEKEELTKLLPENKEWEHAINQYYQAQIVTVRMVCQYFKLDEKDVITAYQNPPARGDAEASEKESINRRKTIMRWMVPEMKRKEMDEVIQAALVARFHVPAELLEALVNMPVPGVTETSQTYLEYLKEIGNRSKAWFDQLEHDSFPTAIFFFPPLTTEYTFVTRAINGWLMLDEQKVDFSPGRSSQSFTLRQGQAYRLSLDSSESLRELTYSTPDNGEQQFVATLRCPAPLAKDVSIALRHLDKGLQVAQAFSLNSDEVRYQHEQGVTMLTPDIATLTRLEQFVQARKEFNVSGSALITYTRRLARLSEAEPTTDQQRKDCQEQLADILYDLTKLDIKDISTFLNNEWPSISVTERAKHLLDMSELHRLHERCEMARNLSVPLADLFKWARLPVLPSEDEDFPFVGQLETALSSGTARNAIVRAKEGLQSQQRHALQEYLLRMPDIRSRKITTADGLSAEFLIDVQMGPVLEISRIAQAIHTVQLFIQRSLLGLEKAYGILTTAIPQARWSWSCKYSLWQANRKVFLYPENWVDPSLRDEKSQAFTELESKVLQTSLTKESIDQILREYVYTVHDLSDLEVESYVWESIQGVHGNYHFFARTRTAPFVFYYRRLSIEGAPHDAPTWNWHPWTKMEVDIPTHEQDFDHKALSRPGTYLLPALYSGRLMLFIPQITRKTLPAKPSKTSTEKLADSTTDDLKSPPLEYLEVRMAWTELRNGKWSPKYVTPTGIEVQPVDNVLPSISSFRFRLPEVPTSSQPSPRPTLVINVDRQKEVEDDTWTYWNLGTFEMQGPRLRLTKSCPDGSKIASEVNADIKFSRFVHNSQAKTFVDLVKEVQNYQVGLTSQAQKLLLALPNPKELAGAEYKLDWLLAFDDSQFPGASGLVVERSTSSHVQSFFGYPHVGTDGKIDRSNQAIPGTDLLTDEASQLLMGEIADNEGFRCIYDLLETLPPTTYGKVKKENSEAYHELKSPTSSYSWELGFHAVALIVERLLATQQFELALEISRLVFDPSRDDMHATPAEPSSEISSSESQRKPLSRLDKCWRFVPFRSSKLRLAGSVRDIIQNLTSGLGKSDEIAYWEANPFSPHAVARRRPAVYMKRFVMKCIETLVASGDQYFRQDSLEAVPLAIQQYTEASELFGPGPVVIDQPTKSVTRTYAQIKDVVNDFSSASVDMELDFPYFINPVDRGTDNTKNGTLGFVKSTYFGVPANPQMQELRDRLDDRLYKIRNGLDINGNPRRLPLFDPPLDVGNLVAAVSGGTSPSSVIGNIQGPMPYYRSTYLIQKALELCNELRSFSESFLAVKEKRDTEAMSSLRVRQERVIQSLTVGIKQTQIEEATSAVDALVESRKAHVMRLKYYLALIGESADEVPTPDTEWSDIPQVIGPIKDKELRMSAEEAEEKELTEAAAHTNSIATALESTTAVLMSLPKLTVQAEPMGVGTSVQMDSSIVGQGILVAAGVIRANAMAQTDGAVRASRKAGAIRQLQDRRLQANMAGNDIKNVDKQIANQRKRIEIAQGELRLQQQQVADTTETEAFLRTKYTSEKLYAWLDMATRKLAYESYIVALDMAKTAERALTFEYGPRAQTILSTGYWDETRDGLLAAQNLGAALRRMEKFHLQNSTHDYELTKTISLRQVSPLALIDLRTKGVAEFILPEVLFDQDFPGHYCRRIKSVSVTIPSIVGPYTGINCTLRLLEHRYRLKAGGASGDNYYARDVSSDERFHTDPIPLSSVALSTCNQDTGTFELQFNGDQYVPFEGAGVISRWRLELPGPFHEFDYRSISDLVLTMRYTAIDGGAIWKKTASDAVVGFRKELNNDLENCGAFLQLDLPVEMSGEWRQLCRYIEQKKDETEAVEMDLSRVPQMLPFWARASNITVQKLWMVLQVAGDGWDDSTASGSIHLLGQELKKPKKEPGSDYVVLTDNKDGALQQGLKDNLKLSVSPKTLEGKEPQSCWIVLQYTIS
ncbi:hypothetical protein SI65_08218 [Aspergillus cristatus]|uniref:Death domain-containing protein n=1 Tax=Aspergillus cristatus TaxID=573508 RepID=A0A1E3B5K4_ASPCR|nr:hypothetical protein SI65_08218 [Aspergillus cristatus]